MSLYMRLAWSNLVRNRKLYLPFLLTGICMVMIMYILMTLAYSPTVRVIAGGTTLQVILYLGLIVIGLFSVLFLFYISGFFMKRRKREFGLYNVLGMGKHHIAKVMLRENMLLGLGCILGGLLLGAVFSKASELCLLKLLKADAPLDYSIDIKYMLVTAAIYAFAFLLVHVRARCQMHVASPVELMRESAAGEQPPRANYVLALVGILLLVAGYVIALGVEDALSALTLFFVAVLCVILGTYACFISASVAILKLLKKNKAYYYRASHFISVSGMAYRMRRNGAGLATICILSTMVLVMISSVTCLYAGSEDALRGAYPRAVELRGYSSSLESAYEAEARMRRAIDDAGIQARNTLQSTYLGFAGSVTNGVVNLDRDQPAGRFAQIYVQTIDDYNRMANTAIALGAGEALLFDESKSDTPQSIVIGDVALKCAGRLDEFHEFPGDVLISVANTLHLIVPDDQTFERIYEAQMAAYVTMASGIVTNHMFDLDTVEEERRAFTALGNALGGTDIAIRYIGDDRAEYYSMYAGLFFIGIVLGLVFIAATVLIMYYKQVTEGYEDQSRFEIMQNVGMTDAEIKKAINSQILTVFFAPLAMAVVHLLFAFPMVRQLLKLFSLDNTPLFLMVTVCSIAAFSIMYALVYKITSYAYLKTIRARGEARMHGV